MFYLDTNPPMERFWHSLDQYTDLDSRTSFTLLTYNILAEKYATSQMYGYVPSWALVWEYRKQMILHEILSYDADIICLQVKKELIFFLFIFFYRKLKPINLNNISRLN